MSFDKAYILIVVKITVDNKHKTQGQDQYAWCTIRDNKKITLLLLPAICTIYTELLDAAIRILNVLEPNSAIRCTKFSYIFKDNIELLYPYLATVQAFVTCI